MQIDSMAFAAPLAQNHILHGFEHLGAKTMVCTRCLHWNVQKTSVFARFSALSGTYAHSSNAKKKKKLCFITFGPKLVIAPNT